jgi:glycine/D-amino acid oxidase-like deaminating enzyme
MRPTEYAIVGGGLVGMAVAWGLQRQGRQVTVFDEGDIAFRAARGNFGLVWIQGKGVKMPVYARWTRLSASLWPGFADELEQETGTDLQLSGPGGLDFCLTESELNENTAELNGLRAALGGDYPFERLDADAVRKLVPEATGDFAGAIFGPEDRHCNPLYLLRALAQAFILGGGRMESGGRYVESGPKKVVSRWITAGNGAPRRWCFVPAWAMRRWPRWLGWTRRSGPTAASC